MAFQEIESDLADNILAHTSIPWTDTFRESESVAEIHAEKLGVRSFDLLHVGLALTLKAIEFLILRCAPGGAGEGGWVAGKTLTFCPSPAKQIRAAPRTKEPPDS